MSPSALILGVEENQWYVLVSSERTKDTGLEGGLILVSFRVPLVCQTMKKIEHIQFSKNLQIIDKQITIKQRLNCKKVQVDHKS